MSLINSYILGFLSQLNNNFLELNIIHDSNLEVKSVLDPENILKKGSIVASRNGTKYYFPNCSGVNRIKEENKVYFSSVEIAENEGYEIASGCTK